MIICGKDISEALHRLIASGSRYRFAVICAEEIKVDSGCLDIGSEISQLITNLKCVHETYDSIFQMELMSGIEKIIKSFTYESDLFGSMVILCNPGILFEPELQIDIAGLLRRISKNTLTILLWPGEADQSKLYFLDKDSKYTINYTDINYTLI